jgi:CzcA family heavy metal efflux pump
MNLPEFSVRQPVATAMLFLALGLLGVFSALRLSTDMYPEIEPPVISILTTWPGASASDVETEVTEVIEDSVNSVNNLDTLTSKSMDNLSLISCKFDWGADLDVAANDVRDTLEFARRRLPEDADTPVLFKFSSAMAPVMFLTVSGNQSWPRLFHVVDKQIGDELKRVPGVGAVILHGGMRRRINIYFDMQKVEGFHLSLPQINRVLDAENLNVPAGYIQSGRKKHFVRVPGRFQSIDEIRQTVVGYHDGRPVHLGEVAEVTDDYKPMDERVHSNGHPSILMMLQKQTGKNTVEVIAAVKQRLAEIAPQLPSDVTVRIPIDTSKDIIDSISNLKTTLLWGIFFIVVVTGVFLRRLRTIFIIVLIIPSSLVIAFIFLNLFGYTINVVSLMALAIASGMVVDNAIVVLENIIRHVEKGGRVGAASMYGASEMALAITASTMTTVVVFVPLMFLSGLAGIMFKQLGFVVVITLLASLVSALMLTPMLASRWVRATPAALRQRTGRVGRFYARSEALFEALERAYGRLLAFALAHSGSVTVLSAAIFVSGLSLVPFISTSFFPRVDTGEVSVSFRLEEGQRIEETERVARQMLDIMPRIVPAEWIRFTYTKTGEDEMGYAVALGFEQGPNVGEVRFKLVDAPRRDLSIEAVGERLRAEVAKIPGLAKYQVSTESGLDSAIMGGRKPISIEVLGYDLQQSEAFVRDLRLALIKVPGLVDVTVSQKDMRPEVWVQIDRPKASSLGLNVAIIAGTLRNYFYGAEATEYKDAGDSFDIFTRFREADRDRLANLPEVPIYTPDGRMVRLQTVARIVEGQGPIEIERKNRQRIIRVEGNTYVRSLGEVNADVRRVIANMAVPAGLRIHFGGDVEEQKEAFADLTLLLVLGIVLVYMVMAALFGNLRDPLIVMFSVPFAFTGVLYAFYLTGTSLGMIPFMGVIMLMGIVVNNAIVLLDYTHLLIRRGLGLWEAVVEAGRNRLRPVLMTTLTTFFAMVPMATSRAVGAEAWNPLGITMLGGLSVSMLVSLVLVPTVFYLFERRKTRAGRGG